MIQFNLLPDVKLEYIRTRKTKQTVMLIAALAAGGSFVVLVLMFLSVNLFQKQHIKNLDKDIKSNTTTLKAIPDIDKILTVQSQLKSLPDLHNQKAVSSRMFEYLVQLTPNQATIAHITVDFSNHTVIVSGKADSLEVVNKYVDTIKFTNFKLKDSDELKPAFSDAVLKTFGRDDKLASYEIDFSFDPTIFDSSKDVSLVVPKVVTTRSQTEKPNVLFQENNQGGQ